MAQTQATSPGTIADNDSIGTAIWNFPERAATQDGTFAIADLGQSAISHYLVATNFGFALPVGATINGIVVEILRQENDLLDNIFDNAVRLVVGGNISSTDRSSSTEWNVNEVNYVSYGSSTDLWGETPSRGNVVASDFGVALSAKATLGLLLTEAEVDHIRMTVYYTDNQTTTSTTTTMSSTSTSTTSTSTSTTSTSSSTTSTSTSTTTTFPFGGTFSAGAVRQR